MLLTSVTLLRYQKQADIVYLGTNLGTIRSAGQCFPPHFGIRMFPAANIAPIHLFDASLRVAMPTRRCLHGRDSPGTRASVRTVSGTFLQLVLWCGVTATGRALARVPN